MATIRQTAFVDVQAVVLDVLRRRAAGESLPDEQVIASHPDLAEHLRKELARLQQICAAGHDAENPRDVEATTTDMRSVQTPGMIQIQCPHCREPFKTAPDTPITEMVCPACGGHFSIASGNGDTRSAALLQSLSHFDLVERLGVGGFGTVWKARDRKLDRTVAIKIPRQGMLSDDDAEKFLREARAAAQLQHPNIVRVHEVGRDGESVFIVSDFVRGIPLNDWLIGQRPTMRQAAEICVTVAKALQHAHERGVIHRDLKPANILIDDAGQPHLMDFGLAKREVGEVTLTLDGQVLGTPAYMSPEQALGEAHTADARSDVYSLGVILFELVTGELPFRGNPRMLMHQVIHDEPPSPRKLDGHVPRDLETIALKCMEKDPKRRYQSAQILGDDLRRYLDGKPIMARPVSRVEGAWRWCKRNPVIAGLTAAVVMVLLAGVLGTSSFAIDALRSESVALAEKQRAEKEAAAARDAERDARAETYRSKILRHGAQMDSALRAWREGDLTRADEILTEVAPEFRELWETRYLANLCRRSSRVLPLDPSSQSRVDTVDFSPDGRTIASGCTGKIILWDVASGEVKLVIEVQGNDTSVKTSIKSVCFSPDGSKLLGGCWDGAIKLWDATTGEEVLALKGHDANSNSKARIVWGVCFSPDGSTIASGGEDGTIRLWDATSGEEKRVLQGHSRTISVSFSPDGSTIASGGVDEAATSTGAASGTEDAKLPGSIKLWDATSGELKHTLVGHNHRVHSISYSPDGRSLASGDREGLVKFWDLATQQATHTLRGHEQPVASVCFSPDGSTIASSGEDRTVRLWDAVTGEPKRSLKGHFAVVYSVCFSADGQLLASAGGDGLIRLWDTPVAEHRALQFGEKQLVRRISFSPDSSTITGFADGSNVKSWDVLSGDQKLTIQDKEGSTKFVEFSGNGGPFVHSTPDGRISARLNSTGPNERWIELWDEVAGKRKKRIRIASLASTHCFSPDGQTIVCGFIAGSIEAWDVSTGARKFSSRKVADELPEWSFQTVTDFGRIYCLCFSPDGRTIAGGLHGGSIKLWDAVTGEEKLTLVGNRPLAVSRHICFSADGDSIACAIDNEIRVWSARLGADDGDTLYPANAYAAAGELNLAIPLYEQALKRRKAELGPDHPDTIRSLSNLAVVLVRANQREASLPLYEELLSWQDRKLGPNHPDTLRAMRKLAGISRDVGNIHDRAARYAEALPLYQRAFELHQAYLGPEHPVTYQSMIDAAVATAKAGPLTEGVPLIEECLEKVTAKFGESHPESLRAMRNFAPVCWTSRRIDDAIRIYTRLAKADPSAKADPRDVDLALALERREKVQRVPGDSRTVWNYVDAEGSGHFRMDKGFWVDECNYPAVPYSFWETARTEEYVELYDPVWKHWIRLYATRAERKIAYSDFRLLSEGHWGKANDSNPASTFE